MSQAKANQTASVVILELNNSRPAQHAIKRFKVKYAPIDHFTSMPDQDSILLQPKLHTPLITSDLIVRSRLLEQLNSGINRPLILMCAPAGFGKTTLVCTRLEHRAADRSSAPASLPAAWLSLEKNDSDLNLFLRYFIAALRSIFNEVCGDTVTLLQVPQQAPQALSLDKSP